MKNNTHHHLIWDFDGTLYDSYPQMTEALLAALADFHYQADYQEAYRLIKKTLYFAAQTYQDRFSIPTEELLAAFRVHHAQQQRIPSMSGLTECLAATKQLGCKHYLFTHRDHRAIDELKSDGLANYFSDFVTREDGFADKPAPDAIVHLIKKHHFTPQDAYMIGDRDIDIQSGIAAGVSGILLDPEGIYYDLEPVIRIQALSDIPALL